jgi:hypothetical protein
MKGISFVISVALIATVLLSGCDSFFGSNSDESQDGSSSTEESLFSEDFEDGDFTASPTWEVDNDDDFPAQTIEVTSGTLHIERTGAGGNGGSAGIKTSTSITVTDETAIELDVRPVSRTVADGNGFNDGEYPVNANLVLELEDGSSVRLRYAFNYGDAIANRTREDFKQFAFSVEQDAWSRDNTYWIRDAWPTAEKITEVSITGSGWDYESYVDNIEIMTVAKSNR